MTHRQCVVAVVVTALVQLTAEARAERRAFTVTYEYLTMAKDGVQIDASTTQAYGLGSNKQREFELQLDAAYGITDRWDVAVFQVYDETANDDPMIPGIPFHYTESRVRTRYRLAERGELPVDLLGYLEVRKAFQTDAWAIAPRAVIARQVDKITLVANLFGDVVFGAGNTTLDLGWAVGGTYEVVPQLKLGAEGFGTKQLKGGSQVSAWVGPSITWAPTPKVWITSGSGFGLTSASIDFRQQVIIGLVL